MEIIEKALKKGQAVFSEYESKQVLAAYHIPVTKEILVNDVKDLINAAQKIGYLIVLKGCSPEMAHKTEKGLIRVDIRNENEARAAFGEIMAGRGTNAGVLVQEMVKGQRELVVGLTRDPQFGPCVMFGLGGIFTEILKDISFRIAPLEKRDALEMMQEIKGRKILGAIRGLEAADLDALSDDYNGVSIIEDVGGGLKLGLGHPMGPFEMADYLFAKEGCSNHQVGNLVAIITSWTSLCSKCFVN